MRKKLTLGSQDLKIEAELHALSADRAAVVTHPHPLYGGDMDNNVVALIAEAYEKLGWTTLRFNFRGVGHSQGQFDQGRGEQFDLQAALDYLNAEGYHRVDLAGYSFGAWIIALWSQQKVQTTARIFLVAPPVAFVDFSTIGSIQGLRAVFTGGRDDIAPPDAIEPLLPVWQPGLELQIIPYADHFFMYHGDALKNALIDAISENFPT